MEASFFPRKGSSSCLILFFTYPWKLEMEISLKKIHQWPQCSQAIERHCHSTKEGPKHVALHMSQRQESKCADKKRIIYIHGDSSVTWTGSRPARWECFRWNGSGSTVVQGTGCKTVPCAVERNQWCSIAISLGARRRTLYPFVWLAFKLWLWKLFLESQVASQHYWTVAKYLRI